MLVMLTMTLREGIEWHHKEPREEFVLVITKLSPPYPSQGNATHG
jgi:hypothetical protein